MRIIHYLVVISSLLLGVTSNSVAQQNQNLKTGYQGITYTEQQTLKDLIRFLQNPALQINKGNIKQVDQKILKLVGLVDKKYKKLTLKERRVLPEGRLIRKWVVKVGKFKQKIENEKLDKEAAELKQMDKLVHLIEIKQLMTQEMKAARINGGGWNGWSTQVKTLYKSLLKKGFVTTKLRNYYESLNKKK
ncbi:hypothetical protein [Microscilla marina]|uniref:RxLR effector protein n=1 Tax=Microscilla marina ATCC 23134 TaxID=313606 RepID=A1ZJY7_MICM2|nr:hypothetical protein [Microscilla marina]EAY29440.1 hypothetical protein M23134_01500 [Microscilla marina ATCC 23134]